jgi:hypothetical protein
MLTFVLLLIFLIIVGLLWLQGLWNNAITLINTTLAAIVALNYFEPVARLANGQQASYKYLWDFLALWGVFALTFGVLRLATDLLSRRRVVFEFWTEMVGRSLLAIWVAWIFIGFTCVTLHTAPLDRHFMGFQKTYDSGNFLGMSPGKQWLGFMQSRSTGALKGGSGGEFDPPSEFILKYYQRRFNFESEQAYRVNP